MLTFMSHEMMTIQQVVEYLKIEERTVYKLLLRECLTVEHGAFTSMAILYCSSWVAYGLRSVLTSIYGAVY